MILACTSYYCDDCQILILNSTSLHVYQLEFYYKEEPSLCPYLFIYLLSVLTHEFLFYLIGCNLFFSLTSFHAQIMMELASWGPSEWFQCPFEMLSSFSVFH